MFRFGRTLIVFFFYLTQEVCYGMNAKQDDKKRFTEQRRDCNVEDCPGMALMLLFLSVCLSWYGVDAPLSARPTYSNIPIEYFD